MTTAVKFTSTTANVRFAQNTTAVQFTCGGMPGFAGFLEYMAAFLQGSVNEYANDEDAISAGEQLYIASASHDSAKKGTLIFIKN